MEEANVRQSVVHFYSWRECAFGWRDLRARKKLREFGVAEYDVSIAAGVECARRYHSDAGKVFMGVLEAAEAQGVGTQCIFGECFGMQETYWDAIAFLLRVLEHTTLADHRNAGAKLGTKEWIAVAGDLAKLVAGKSQEELCVGDWLSSRLYWRRSWREAMGMGELVAFSYGLAAHDLFGAMDREVNGYGLAPRERILFAEVFVRKLRVLRSFLEAVRAKESPQWMYGLFGYEDAALAGALLHASQSVLSNIAVNGGELSMERFLAAIDTPPLYERFMDFNVGEYEYKRALVRLAIESQSIGSEPVIYDAVMNVDIDDTDDRGMALITDTGAPSRVYFHKFYYHPPEVSVSLKGGNAADGVITPYLVSVGLEDLTGRYFEVELLNGNGSRVTGQISWTSKGY